MKRVVKMRMRSTVIATLKDGSSFRGVLYDYDSEALILRDVEALTPGAGPTPVDGELLVLVANVAYVQVL